MRFEVLHHGADEASGFDAFDVVVLLVVILTLAAISYGIWKVVQRRRELDED